MRIGILLITHGQVGNSLEETVKHILGEPLPLSLRTFSVQPEMSTECACEQFSQLCQEIQQNEGVLILTDLINATPCNIAKKMPPHCHISMVAGLNLPMLLKVMNYAARNAASDLESLTQRAIDGGREGITAVEFKRTS